MKHVARVLLAVLAFACAARAAPPPVTLQALPFQIPGVTEIAHAGDGSGRLLDIRSRVIAEGEQGLLGLAFDMSNFFANSPEFQATYESSRMKTSSTACTRSSSNGPRTPRGATTGWCSCARG